MNYKILKNGVVEIKTNQIVFTSDDQNILRKVKRNLNGGRGFAGFTPAFFLESI